MYISLSYYEMPGKAVHLSVLLYIYPECVLTHNARERYLLYFYWAMAKHCPIVQLTFAILIIYILKTRTLKSNVFE